MKNKKISIKEKVIVCLILLFSCLETLSSQIESTFDYSAEGQRVCLVDVTVDLESISATLHLRDANFNTSDVTSIYRRKLYGRGSDWKLQVSGLPPGTNSWTDTNVDIGEVWEYQLRRTHSNGVAFGYAVASLLYDQSNYRGQMILVVSNDYAEDFSDKILRLKRDLTADGWYVNELIVQKGFNDLNDGHQVVGVKDSITMIYNNAPIDDKPKVLFILGSVPLPRLGLGLQTPDDHITNAGARGSDSYYADLDGVFTDNGTYETPQQLHFQIKNIPGDYKWDQDKIPSELEMGYGRVSFLGVSDGHYEGELARMELYLDRLHDYRYVLSGKKIGINTAFSRGYANSRDASYRCLPALSGGEKVHNNHFAFEQTGHNQWVANNGPFIWYMSNRFVPQLQEWENIGMDALVYSSDQSFFGYGDIPINSNNSNWHESVIRRILGYDTKCLIAIWTTTAINVFHQAGIGEPLAYACKFIMDHNIDNQLYEKVPQPFDNPELWNRTYFNFFGDPTLRLYQTFPISNLKISTENNEFRLDWNASIDENLCGYHIYKSDSEFGIYHKISGASAIADTFFIDPLYEINDWYMVKAIGKQISGSGIFLNPSHGIFVQGDMVLSNLNTNESEGNIEIYPNPAQKQIQIDSEMKIDGLEIWNSNGKMIMTDMQASSNNKTININHLPIGTYLLKIHSGGKIKTKRFIKI